MVERIPLSPPHTYTKTLQDELKESLLEAGQRTGGPSSPAGDKAPSALLNATSSRLGSCLERFLRLFSIRSREEAAKVGIFVLAAFLGNTFFVIGRNVGTVIFMHSRFGAEYLPTAIFASGALTTMMGSFFSSVSTGNSTVVVNKWLLIVASISVAAVYAGLHFFPEADGVLAIVIYFGAYIVEDILTMFIAMQSSTVAQSAFSVTDAKRLFGLVQLGNSIAAMTVGLSIGEIAALVGTEMLLLLQVFVLVLSVVVNEVIGCQYVNEGSQGGKKKKKAAQADALKPWYKNALCLAMGFWSFTVIFVKTMYEYEYNILVAESVSAEQMVALTGYLYAGAGLASSIVNVAGSKVCLGKLGMRGSILATPGCLLLVSLLILVSPSVGSTFAGRLVDLTLRWSLNNTVRSVLWIAVPTAQAVAAKPWVEGTIKKMGSAFNALVITVALAASGGSMNVLSILSLSVTGTLFVICIRVYELYLKSMWYRITKREVHVSMLPDLDLAKPVDSLFEEDKILRMRVFDRLLNGDPAQQLYIVREMGEGIPLQDWEAFFSHFHELTTPVQVKIIELGRRQHFRVSDEFLLSLLRSRATSPAVTTATCLTVGERRLHSALDLLQAHLGNPEPSVRAAAAAAILLIGWGVGLGTTSSAALMVLEDMLGFRFKGGSMSLDAPGGGGVVVVGALHLGAKAMQAPASRLNRLDTDGDYNPPGSAAAGAAFRADRTGSADSMEADDNDPEALEHAAERLQAEWETAIAIGDRGRAVVLGIQLTYVKTSLTLALRDQQQPENGGASHRRKPAAWDQADATKGASAAHAAVALEKLQLLPTPRDLISYDVWLFDLLRHPSHIVRVAAMAFVHESDKHHERFKDETKELVRCLGAPDTHEAAEKALRKLSAPLKIQEELLHQLQGAVKEYKHLANIGETELLRAMSVSEVDQCLDLVSCPADRNSPEMQGPAPGTRILGFLKYLQRQSSALEEKDIKLLYKSKVCDELLRCGEDLSDSDEAQQLHAILVDLRSQGFSLSPAAAEARLRVVAVQFAKGLAVKQWVQQLHAPSTERKSRQIRDYLALPGTEDVSGASCHEEVREQVNILKEIATRYINEHNFLQKRLVLHLAVLAADEAVKSTTLNAAWRALRSGEEVAVLEVLDSILPLPLKEIVLPLLDSSSLSHKMSVCAKLSPELQDAGSAGPPPWMTQWFKSSADRLGAELAMLCNFLTAAARGGSASLPSPPPWDALLPKLVLLWPVKQSEDLLAIHIAEIARIATLVHVRQGEQLCRQQETYVVVKGTFKARLTQREFAKGKIIQKLHMLSQELPAQEVNCTSPGGGAVLRICYQDLFEVMLHLPPKFALGLLKSLMRMLPAPSQTGGSKAPRRAPEAVDKRQRPAVDLAMAFTSPSMAIFGKQKARNKGNKNELENGSQVDFSMTMDVLEREGGVVETSDDLALLARQCGAEDDDGGVVDVDRGDDVAPLAGQDNTEDGLMAQPQLNYRGEHASFSMLEKLMLLQAVKIFRYVPLEYLPSIAQCCQAEFFAAGSTIVQEDKPTDKKLYIVADGNVGLYRADVLQRSMHVSDAIGNTALLLDKLWEYTALAVDDVWLLSISRSDLTDLLRGRRELASAVIRGLYKTLTRRMQQVEDQADQADS
eukprot:TRINITY_DN14103_c0_g1_i1.p1 TRINITY_DN14103_c0_g1~~TRINITY_DN14103_c0_g1_i1.p1  ORF type:complete len:1639 (+),score=459.90 TRINITY_DN14103_c0_g1_i1:68-4984(+)